ncbi:MAG: class I SAM-dependent rRNA methyltransferase [Campylobacterota bacterium]
MKKITVSKEAIAKLKSLFCWVYQNELATPPKDLKDGESVEIYTAGGEYLATGYINQKSVISVRVLSFEKTEINKEFFRTRLQTAIDKRKQIQANSNAYRLVHSEADFLAGLIVDFYNGYLAIQINTLGMENQRDIIIELLVELLNPKGIFDKSDAKVRKKECIETQNGVIYGEVPNEIEIVENGIKFAMSLHDGQKTGFYLDQRRNRHIVSKYIQRDMKVLDVFCNAGGFGLYALSKGAKVQFVDASASAISQVENNITLNGYEQCTAIKTDAFEFLTQELESNNKYDLIVLDPPPFAKTQKEAIGAMKGMKFLLDTALKMLNPNGMVAIYSCSHHIGMKQLEEMSFEISKNAKIPLQIVEYMYADIDHPNIINIPNSAYLTGLLLRK